MIKTFLEFYKEKRITNNKFYYFLSFRNLLNKKTTNNIFEEYVDLFYLLMHYEASLYTKTFFPKLKNKKIGKRNPYIVVTSNEGYDWCGKIKSLNVCHYRNGKTSSLLNILIDTLFEYYNYTDKYFDDLQIEIIEEKEMRSHKIFGEYFLNISPVSVNVKSTFFKND